MVFMFQFFLYYWGIRREILSFIDSARPKIVFIVNLFKVALKRIFSILNKWFKAIASYVHRKQILSLSL